jgi:transcriptional regulator with XRE-family HTH domain
MTERIEVLKRFQAEADSADLKVDADFQRILRKAKALLEISDQEIADSVSVSRPTVNRWMNGKNLPYNAMRRPILTWINEQLSVKIKRLGGSFAKEEIQGREEMTQLYKLQYFSEKRNKWMDSNDGHRDSLAKMKRLALRHTGMGSGLLVPMPYRAVIVKKAKKKTSFEKQ